MLFRTRGAEAQGAGPDRLDDDLGHPVDLPGGGVLVVRAALAHDVGADGAVGDLRRHVQRQGAFLQGVEVLGKAFPVPLDSLVQGGTRNIFHALHQADQPVALFGFAGREADTAIAGDDSGNAVAGGGREVGIPGHLAVKVRMNVDESRGDDLAAGVDLLARLTLDGAHRGDTAVLHGDVGVYRAGAGAIVDAAVADDEVVHGNCSRGPITQR